jgi:hypothetical protein
MRSFASAVIGFAMVTSGYAQSNSPGAEFQPIPDTIPGLLIDPAPLSGTLLRPLTQSPGGSLPVGAAANPPASAPPAVAAPAGSAVATTSDPVASPAPMPAPAPQPAPGAAAPPPTPQPGAPAAPGCPRNGYSGACPGQAGRACGGEDDHHRHR